MDNPLTFSVSPIQAILALGFQLWLVIFPILLLRKVNYLTALLEDHLGEETEEESLDA